MSDIDSLKKQAVSASKWSTLSEVISKGIYPIIYVLLARLLTPVDFGVVAAATMIITFSQIFWDAGLSKAIIQTKDDINTASNIVFYSNMVLGLTIYIIIFLTSDYVALLFKDPRISIVLKVQGIQVILLSLCSVQTALLQRTLDFKSLFEVRLLTNLVPGLISLPLAFIGYGYWALVFGTLIGAFLQLVTLWKIHTWRPSSHYDPALAVKLFKFGIWVSGSGILGWFYLWMDALIVGAHMSSHELGLYRTGNVFSTMVLALILSPLMPVLYSTFSKLECRVDKFKDVLMKSTKLIFIIILPVALILYIYRNEVSNLIFGSNWVGIGEIIGIMALAHGVSWLIGANNEAYRAFGRPDIETKIMLAGIFFYLPVYLFAITYGLTVFLWARFLLVVFFVPIQIYISNKFFMLETSEFLHNIQRIVVAIFLTVILGWVINSILTNVFQSLLRNLIVILVSAIIYSFLIYMFERKYLINVIVPLAKHI